MNTDTVMNPVGRRFTTRVVRGDDERFVTIAAEMLDHPKHRVRNAIDIREEGFCDDCNAHDPRVASAFGEKVATRKMTREQPVRRKTARGSLDLR